MNDMDELEIIMNGLENVIIPLIAITATMTMIVLVVYFVARYNYLTKKMLIEKGIDASFFQKRERNRVGLALAAFGFGLGMLVSYFLGIDLHGDVIFWAAPIMFTGLGLLLAFFIHQKIENRNKEN